MNIINNDTIVAQATAPGRGGVGIIRISGLKAHAIGKKITNKLLVANKVQFSRFFDKDNNIIDEGIVLFFRGPNSYTGEDIIELQGHGGPVVMNLLLKSAINLGARLATPGEFTKKAFLNGKIDLTQAEAVADLIDAQSKQAVKSAMVSLQGVFSKKINDLLKHLIDLRMFVEASIDFVEEDIDYLSQGKILEKLQKIALTLNLIKEQAKQGAILKEGITVVLAGKPNSGKSTLLNTLAGKESAIVTHIPGTTRDLIKEYILLNGVPLHVVDTAGLRNSEDLVEKIGIDKTYNIIKQADRILLVIDIQEKDHLDELLNEYLHDLPNNIPVTVIFNKIDLYDIPAKIDKLNNKQKDVIYLSAKHNQGIDLLRKYLLDKIGFEQNLEGLFIARARHLDAINRAQNAINDGLKIYKDTNTIELLAEDLRSAQNVLSEITGEFTTENLLDEIFSKFCLGK